MQNGSALKGIERVSRPRTTFLSSEWFAAAFQAAVPVVLDRTVMCRLDGITGPVRWHLVVERGRVISLDLGELETPDVTLHWGIADAWRIARGELDGNEALLRTTATAELDDGTYVGTPAPMDLLCRPELALVTRRPDATMVVHHRLTAALFGDLDYVVDIVDGQLVGERLSPPETKPDVFIEISYRKLGLVRTGQCTILEAIEGGKIDGDVGALAALAAIYESPEVEAAFRATGSQSLALATLGELGAVPGFQERFAELIARTETYPGA